MRRMSLGEAKAHLSELVDSANERGTRTIILRHGKPAAAIVPVEVALRIRGRRSKISAEEVERSVYALVDEISAAQPEIVSDLLHGRR